MPDISVPVTFADGTTADAPDLNLVTYRPRSVTPAGLEILNGYLDGDNRLLLSDVRREDVRRGAFSRGEMVGATAAKDYFADLFVGVRGPDSTAEREGVLADTSGSGSYYTDRIAAATPHSRFIPLAGAGKTYYLPHACSQVYLFWHCTVRAEYPTVLSNTGVSFSPSVDDGGGGLNSANGDKRSTLRLFLEDEAVYECSTRLIDDTQSWVPGKGRDLDYFGNSPGLRFWSGFYLIDAEDENYGHMCEKGWHNASIRVCLEDGIWSVADNFVQTGLPSGLPEYLYNSLRAFNVRMGYVYIR